MSNSAQQLLSLGLGGVLIGFVGLSIWRLIGAWSSLASTERSTSTEERAKADAMAKKLTEEIALRVALEVEVKFLKHEIAELKARILTLESEVDDLEHPD